MIAVKSRSIDVTKSPSDVYRGETLILENRGFKILETIRLESYERDHAMVIAKRE